MKENKKKIDSKSNYLYMLQLKKMQIVERDKISYIQGKTKPPSEFDEGYEKWYAKNQKVKRHFLMSMSPKIIRHYLCLPTTYEIQDVLSKAFYDGSDELQVFSLNQKSFSTKQNEKKKLFVYYGELIEIFQESDHCDKVVMKDPNNVMTYRRSIK